VLTPEEATAALRRQKELYTSHKGFIRFLALLRADGRLTHDEDRKIRLLARPRTVLEKSERHKTVRLTPMTEHDSSAARVRLADPSGSTYAKMIAALA
jgi:hypothetical protein